MNYVIGIDEAGRGPLAGPVSVGVFKANADFDFSIFENLKDSKKLSEKRRKEIFKLILSLKKENKIDFAFSLVSNLEIDRIGITGAIKKGIENILDKICATPESKIFLDGGIKAPIRFINQETIIKGDEKIPQVALASIVAKVVRDEFMKNKANDFPEYGFDIHKGYGTLRHRESIKKHGLSTLHRKTFCRAFL